LRFFQNHRKGSSVLRRGGSGEIGTGLKSQTGIEVKRGGRAGGFGGQVISGVWGGKGGARLGTIRRTIGRRCACQSIVRIRLKGRAKTIGEGGGFGSSRTSRWKDFLYSLTRGWEGRGNSFYQVSMENDGPENGLRFHKHYLPRRPTMSRLGLRPLRRNRGSTPAGGSTSPKGKRTLTKKGKGHTPSI